MDQTSNHLKVLITVAAILGGIIMIGWIWKKRSSSSDKSAGGNRDLTSNRRPSCTPPSGQDYEVFLSFRGEDTRKDFTDHLYNRLNDAGVWVFRDNEGLQVGEELGPELMKAIKASKISIPVISRNYASSEWCLRELVQILECKKTGQKVLPIFYKVTPSDVRNQMGEFKNAFYLHQNKYGSNQIQEWRNALKEVASLKGLESDNIADGHEGELVKIILAKVIKKLKKANLVVGDYLIGVQVHVEKIKKMFDTMPSNEVQVILIHGMGGIGKTTLAKLIFNQFSNQYEHSSFLPNVRERSLDNRGKVDLQKQLISDILGKMHTESVSCTDAGINIIRGRFKGKKVLILLDDVNHRDQLNALARESDWFAPGSKIIVTSRNYDILAKWKNRLTYGLNELDAQQSFQLFCFHAFGRDVTPRGELKSIAKEMVSMTGGLPLAIEVIGSLLFARAENCWEDKLKILKETPSDEVMDILRISYNSLKYEEKQIFLDIACFSFEPRENFAYYMWDSCGFHPQERLRNLISLSLIKIGDEGEVIMHDQLKDLGRAIVREKSFNDLGKRSRLWIRKEAEEVLTEKQGTEKVEAISLLLHEKYEEYCLTSEHFKDLKKLRLLVLERAHLHGDFNNLLTNLKWLRWEGSYSKSKHFETMPTNFHPKKLAVLELKWLGSLTEHWSLWSQVEVVKKLKVVRITGCPLTTTPDFSTFEELEILILCGCSWLIKIHPSIHNVSRTLTTLNVSECTKLSKLPDSIGSLVNLHTLSLQGCRLLTKIPASIGHLGVLSELDLADTSIAELPESIGDLHNLEVLDISNTRIERLTPAIRKLRKLQYLSAERIRTLTEFPEIGELTSLQYLSLWRSQVFCIPDLPCGLTSLNISGDWMEKLPSFSNLTNLKVLKYEDLFWKGNKAFNIDNLINLETLDINIDSGYCKFNRPIGSLFLELSSSIVILTIFNCPALFTLPNLSNSKHLTHLTLFKCRELGNINGLEGAKNIKEIIIQECSNLVEIQWPDSMEFLEFLVINDCLSLERIGDLSRLNMLKVLRLERVKLSVVEGIDQLTTIEELRLLDLPSLKTIGDLSNMKKMKRLEFFTSDMLCNVEGTKQLITSKRMDISSCPCLESIGDLSNMKKLKKLRFFPCDKLRGVEGIGQLTSLESIDIYGCPRLESIGDLSNMKKLKELWLSECDMLRGVEGIGQLTSLERIHIHGCLCLESIGDLSDMKKLKELWFSKCDMLRGVKGIGQLTSLERIDISGCPCLESIGDLSQLQMLERLNIEKLSGVEGIGQLRSLKKLRVSFCPSLERINDLSHLEKLEKIKLSTCEMLSNVEGIGQLTSLEKLVIENCPRLESIGDLSHLRKLKELELSECGKLSGVEGICQLTSLETLGIIKCPCLESIGDLSHLEEFLFFGQHLHLKELNELELYECENSSGAEGICQLTSLETILIIKSLDLKIIGDLSNFKELNWLELYECENLNDVEGICQLTSLETLVIKKCPCLESINDLSYLKELKKLKLYECKKLSGVEGICQLTSLETLVIEKCPCLESIGDLSNLKKLKKLELNECKKLSGVEGICQLTSLYRLKIEGCKFEYKRHS